MDSLQFKEYSSQEIGVNDLRKFFEAKKREFNEDGLSPEELERSAFIFLKDSAGELLAMARLVDTCITIGGMEIPGAGISDVISNIQGKGYGKMVMQKVKEYLRTNKIVGVGFCAAKNKEFYEKCGFAISAELIKKIVFVDGDEEIINQGNDFAFYYDPSGNEISKVNEGDVVAYTDYPPIW